VIGFTSANARTASGMLSVGTNAELLQQGRLVLVALA
jgi:hypothetical protein